MPTKSEVILKVNNLKQYFKTGVGRYKLTVKAVDDISFEIKRGEVFSLVGESGCGKTTTGRTIIKLYKPTDGEAFLLGKRIVAGTLTIKEEMKRLKSAYREKLNENPDQNELKALKAELREKSKELRKEAKQRKRDQLTKYRPTKKEVNAYREQAKQRIADIKEEMKRTQQTFLAFKKNAFSQTDALGSSVSREERDQFHAKELQTYRETRAAYREQMEKLNNDLV